MSDRILKINELVREQVARIIGEQMEFEPGTLVTVLSARTSHDLKYSKIFVSVIPDSQSEFTLKRLNNYGKIIQKELGANVTFKFTPKLTFALDETESKAVEIDKLLDSLK
jgi:ribosome-binding factor A